MKRLFFHITLILATIFIAAILIKSASHKQGWSKEWYPNPYESYTACKTPSRFLCDPDDIIPTADKKTIGHILDKFESKTRSNFKNSTCGICTGVALMKKMKSPYWKFKETAENFSKYIYKRWKLDRKNCIILIISVLDRRTYIYTTTRRIANFHINSILLSELQVEIRNGQKPALVVTHAILKLQSMLSNTSKKHTVYNSLTGNLIFLQHFSYWLIQDYLCFVASIFIAVILSLILFAFVHWTCSKIYHLRYKNCFGRLKEIELDWLKETIDFDTCLQCSRESLQDSGVRVLLCGHKYCKDCANEREVQTCGRCPVTPNAERLLLRLQSLQRLYPTVITNKYIETWTSRDFTGKFSKHRLLTFMDWRVAFGLFLVINLLVLSCFGGSSMFRFTSFDKVARRSALWVN
ncbi:predicted protein [Nematostella vectensis]|uniref:RING-type domain-containing protein n=1 Tax=Nematostella vectensis TaxID=45351 RepID=A7RF56_NEMVE|nr:predicted protein [Nematostella vectensis]|eukprot:XP_001641963.1 predicted protein [Nematostella vectensis]